MFRYHKTLPPRLWDSPTKINTLVSHTLQMIAGEFIRYLHNTVGMPISHKDIKDVFVHGSAANYYWDKYSDIDLCIVADLGALRDANPEANNHLFARSFINSWLQTYSISIFGRGVDISLIDSHDKVGPKYSLMQDKWLVTPQRLNRTELRTIKRLAQPRYRLIMRECRYMLRHKMPAEYIDTYLVVLQNKRTRSMRDQFNQPITSMAMAFKMVRNTGIIRRLKKFSKQQRSKKYQLK